MKMWDFVYKYFWWFGRGVLKLYPNLPDNIRRSGMHIYPEAYASFIGFATITSVIVTIVLIIVVLISRVLLALPFVILVPFLTFISLVNLPSLIGSSRAGSIEGELPYTAAYLSVMVSSGVSPYDAFERISRSKAIFPKFSDISQKFILLVRVLGKDPLTAFSILAERTPSASTRDLLTGYITTVRAGGDVGDYLTKKARMMFSEILVKMKIIADRLSGLLEAYLALVLLTMISLSVMYFVTVSLASAVTFGLSASGMYLFLYVFTPFLSFMIIYLADVMQYKEPWIDYKPYIVYCGLTIPLALFLIVLGYIIPSSLPPWHPMANNPIFNGVKTMLLFPEYFVEIEHYLEPVLAVSMALIYATIPSVVYTEYKAREYKIVNGVTRFLRDLVEIRKTGLSPERSIIELSSRNYGVFTKHLRRMAMQLSLGIPLSRIISTLLKKIIVWRAKALLYMLTDAIEVGGGTIEVLENLAWFAENVDAIEDAKKKNLRTLLVVPYMGSILATTSILLLAIYMGSLALGSAAYATAAATILPAIVLNSYIMGLVAGKISSGSVSAGFKHALILTIVAVIVILISPVIKASLVGAMLPEVTR